LAINGWLFASAQISTAWTLRPFAASGKATTGRAARASVTDLLWLQFLESPDAAATGFVANC
jgi:hypothetical protein